MSFDTELLYERRFMIYTLQIYARVFFIAYFTHKDDEKGG